MNRCPYCKIEFTDNQSYKLHMSQHMTTEEQLNQERIQRDQTLDQQISKLNFKQHEIYQISDIKKLNIDMNRHIFVSGQTQRGKSYFIKELIMNIDKSQRLIFLDYKHDPNHLPFISKFKIFKSLDGIKDYLKDDTTGQFMNKRKKDMRVVYRPLRIETEEIETNSLKNPRWKMINRLCEYVFKHGNIILVIDEAAPFSSVAKIPPNYYDLLIMGAARGVTVINITQRPTAIHNSLISESYTKILFRHDIESDRKKLAGMIGNDNAEQLATLPSKVFMINLSNGLTFQGTLI